jgi:hypothetical protein
MRLSKGLSFGLLVLLTCVTADAQAVVRFKTTAAAKAYIERQTLLAHGHDFIAADKALAEMKLGPIQSLRLAGTEHSARYSVAVAALALLNKAEPSGDPTKVAAARKIAESPEYAFARSHVKVDRVAARLVKNAEFESENHAWALHKVARLAVTAKVKRTYAERASQFYLRAAGHAATNYQLEDTIRLVEAAREPVTEFGFGFDQKWANATVLKARNGLARSIRLSHWWFGGAKDVLNMLKLNRTAVRDYGAPSLLKDDAVRAEFAAAITRFELDPHLLDE